MRKRTNQEWLAALRGSGRDEALAGLRALLVRSLRYALGERFETREVDLEDFAQEAILKILAALLTALRAMAEEAGLSS